MIKWVVLGLKCPYCNKRIGLFDKNVHVLANEEIKHLSAHHEKCWLKFQIECRDEEIKNIKKELDQFDRLSLSWIAQARGQHIKKGKISQDLVMSPDLEVKFLQDSWISQSVVYNSKKIMFLGMEVKVDPNITGWYIQ